MISSFYSRNIITQQLEIDIFRLKAMNWEQNWWVIKSLTLKRDV